MVNHRFIEQINTRRGIIMNLLNSLQETMGCVNLSEELHTELKDILDSESSPRVKHGMITKKIRALIKDNKDTGLVDDKPKKGSSRAVYFPKEEKSISIDGVKTSMPTAVKIAFSGVLDKYRSGEPMLGELQNSKESGYHNDHFSVLRREGDSKNHIYNEDGVLAPVVDHSNDDSWLEMGKVSPLTTSKFKQLTKTDDMPKGMNFNDFQRHLVNEHEQSRGRRPYWSVDDEERVSNHPLTENVKNFMFDTGTDPRDLHKGNLGIWKHPITGKEHVVISDYGYDDETDKAYNDARIEHRNSMRGRY